MDEISTHGITATALLRNRHHEVKGMFDQLLNSVGGERQELFDCLRATLAVHETVEEIVIHPKVRGFDDAGREAVEARLQEEQRAKEMLAGLEQLDTRDSEFPRRIAVFRDAVVAHAEAEEREVFPRIEQRCSLEEQCAMAARIERAEKLAPTHPHPHGPTSAVGNMIVGPFAAIVDRVRDALR